MTQWTTKAHDLLTAQATLIADIIRTTDPDDPALQERRYTTTLAGDERKLRGIPAIGRGVAGAIPGSQPGGGNVILLPGREDPLGPDWQ